MFDFRRALASVLETHPDDDLFPLYTPWGEALDAKNVLQEYPRPQMRRSSYINLNGMWEYAFRMTNDGLYGVPETLDSEPEVYDGTILVPFSPETILSGVNRQLMPKETLWYKRSVTLSIHEHKRVILHFEAVDFACSCFVNGFFVGTHHGSYAPFSFDITDALSIRNVHGEEEITFSLVLAVKDPSEYGCQPRGKQRIERGSIWCTAQSGIWQTVWIEEVPEVYIERLHVVANPDERILHVAAKIRNASTGQISAHLTLTLGDSFNDDREDILGPIIASTTSSALIDAQNYGDLELSIPVQEAHLWSPDDPYLYGIKVTCDASAASRQGVDEVISYCAFRTITAEYRSGLIDEGINKEAGLHKVICLNHKPIFLKGILDQGYWPDGLLTAPSEEALKFDIDLAKRFEFNLIRKHLKSENARWYYLCDKMGILVWQDMVNGGAQSYSPFYTSQLPTVFPHVANKLNDTRDQDRFGIDSDLAKDLWVQNTIEMVEYLREFPCIVGWTVFNEAWGQFDAQRMTNLMFVMDSTRLYDQTSGWCDQGGGDLISEHNYFRDIAVPKPRSKDDDRVPFISEFGGYAHYTKNHCCAPRAYGYAVMDTLQDFNREVTRILNEAVALFPQGLGGFVYTQLSDVEDEVNGLVTYDRRVVKYQPDR